MMADKIKPDPKQKTKEALEITTPEPPQRKKPLEPPVKKQKGK